jgi:hypothetical protein
LDGVVVTLQERERFSRVGARANFKAFVDYVLPSRERRFGSYNKKMMALLTS